MGRGGGQVVSVLAFYSEWSELESRWSQKFFCKIVFERNENKQKGVGVGPLF